jgi:hypothetical protein
MRNPSKVLFNAVAVSGTSAYYSDWVEVDQLSYGMLHINWTGTPTGAIVYHGSNDPAIETERERLRGQAPATQGSGSGSAASMGAVVAGVATLSGLTGMSAERVGDSLTISGAATGPTTARSKSSSTSRRPVSRSPTPPRSRPTRTTAPWRG